MSELVFEALDRGALGDVRCAASRARVDGEAVLVLAYRGTYRDGSRGSPDAVRMRADALAAMSAWPADAVVFDLRELRYRRGDGMISVFAAEPPEALDPIASAVVWIVGAYRTTVLAGTRDDLEWVRAELGGISVRDPEGGAEEVGVVAAPLAELPRRLLGLAGFGE